MRTVLHGGLVLDARGGSIGTADIVLEGATIADVGSALDGDGGIDCSGLTLVPGLIDCHAHMAFAGLEELSDGEHPPTYLLLKALPSLRRTLQLGVTTVRDAWGADAGLRDAIDHGYVVGPRLVVSLAQLCGTGGIGDHFRPDIGEDNSRLGSPHLPRGVFDGPAEARGAVRRMVRSDADVIKVAATGSITRPETADHFDVAEDELAEIVAEARRHGRHVMAHAHGARAAEAAALAGVRSIEHGARLDEQAVAVLAEAGTWLVPTLSATQASADREPAWMAEVRDRAAQAFRWALDAEVPIAMGTDCPVVPHEKRLDELALMKRLGMAPMQIWRAATYDAARLLDRTDIGLLEPTRRANIVAVQGDLESFEALDQRIAWVRQDGRLVSDDGAR
jgi:imidazolonepropionase-like amidohydrolase